MYERQVCSLFGGRYLSQNNGSIMYFILEHANAPIIDLCVRLTHATYYVTIQITGSCFIVEILLILWLLHTGNGSDEFGFARRARMLQTDNNCQQGGSIIFCFMYIHYSYKTFSQKLLDQNASRQARNFPVFLGILPVKDSCTPIMKYLLYITFSCPE